MPMEDAPAPLERAGSPMEIDYPPQPSNLLPQQRLPEPHHLGQIIEPEPMEVEGGENTYQLPINLTLETLESSEIHNPPADDHTKVSTWIQGLEDVDVRAYHPEAWTAPVSFVPDLEKNKDVTVDPCQTSWSISFTNGLETLKHMYNPYDFITFTPHPSMANFVQLQKMDPTEILVLQSYWAMQLPMSGHFLDLSSSGCTHFPQSYRARVETGDIFLCQCGPYMDLLNTCSPKGAYNRWLDFNIFDPKGIVSPSKLLLADPSLRGLDVITNLLTAHCLRFPVTVFGSLWQLANNNCCIYLVLADGTKFDGHICTWMCQSRSGMERAIVLGDILRIAGWNQIEVTLLRHSDHGASHNRMAVVKARKTVAQTHHYRGG
ncbi:hypothetical protein F5Y14DRAFT_456404 [Nemania sp. NC0429]|nr:hypothetical protein F5Y14DRAFT_456404 [Nemania sp. NC0429]